ncbi:hypothetical protein E9101_22670 [Salmonella enterica subsp. enterica serovar Goldcoast]|uniref:hypothetical protein n=1 Tax=Salmonella enterica TaxID=28901 RepID=UPI001121C57D|nr:hypothetical protein [Salmonella enterica]TPD12279.1 hypothetical protein E9101_22670 [Salmonella enterica subsp. enterica serovar Goldcoast]
MTEQKLVHCQQLADLTPLIATLGFWSDIDLPFWAGFGLLTLTPMIRNVPADKGKNHITTYPSSDTGAWVISDDLNKMW